jgi:hypothetical protein
MTHKLTRGQRIGVGMFLFGLAVQTGISAYIIVDWLS